MPVPADENYNDNAKADISGNSFTLDGIQYVLTGANGITYSSRIDNEGLRDAQNANTHQLIFDYSAAQPEGQGSLSSVTISAVGGSAFNLAGIQFLLYDFGGSGPVTLTNDRGESLGTYTLNGSGGRSVFLQAGDLAGNAWAEGITSFTFTGTQLWLVIDNLDFEPAAIANTPPAIGHLHGDSVDWPGVGSTIVLDVSGNATVSDAELGAANNWAGASLTVQRGGTAVASDVFGFNTGGALFTVSGGTLQSGGSTFATYTSTGGVLTIQFTSSAATATTALVQDVLQRVTYRNDTPSGDATLRFTLNDGSGGSATADVVVTSDMIYVTNTTDTAVIDPGNGTSLSEAVAIAAADATGSQTLVLTSAFSGSSVSLAGSLSISESLSINADSAAGLTVSGGTTVTLGGGTALSFINSTGTVTINATLAGIGSLVKYGAGTLALGSVSNEANMSGGITVNGGSLQIGSDDHLSSGTLTLNGGSLTNGTSAFTIDNAIVLGSSGGGFNVGGGAGATQVGLAGVVSGSGGLAKSGQAILELSGNNTYTGATNVTAGTVIASHANAMGTTAGATTVASGATVRLAGGLTFAESFYIAGTGKTVSSVNYGALHLTNGTSTVSGTVTLTGNADVSAASGATLTLSGALAGGYTLNKTDAGTLVLNNSGNATGLTGGTTITAGTLSVASDAHLGSGAVTLAGGTLAITGATTIDNAVAVAAASTLGNSADATLSGVLSGSGTLTKSGAGALTLSGSNTHSGDVSVTAGTLVASGGSAIGNASAVTLSGTGALQVSTSETVGALTGDSTAVTDVVFDSGTTLTATYASNASFGGVMGGAGGFTKAGSGTLTLTGANTYTGATTVSAGTLVLDRSGGALSNSTAVSVSAGATLTVAQSDTVGNLAGAGTVALGTQTLAVGGGATSNTIVSGAITGSGTLAKNGNYNLTLSGDNSGQAWGLGLNGGAVILSSGGRLGSGAVSLSNTGALYATSDSTLTSLSNNLVMTGAGSINNFNALTLTGTISGTGTLSKFHSSTLTLSTGINNGSAWGLTIIEGAVSIDSALRLGTGTVSIYENATLAVTGATTLTNAFTLSSFGLSTSATVQADAAVTLAGQISGSVGLNKTGSGTLTLARDNTYGGGTTLTAGAVSVDSTARLGTGGITFKGGALAIDTATALNFSNAVNMAGAGSIRLVEGGAATFSGLFSGSGVLDVTGVAGGAREVLTLTNTGNAAAWAGGIALTDATLSASASSVLGTGAIVLNNGGELRGTAAVAIGNAVAVAGTGTVYANVGALELSGVVSGAGTLFVGGQAGTSVTLSGSNTHGGSVVVDTGKLVASGGAALGDNAQVTVRASGALELAADETIGSLIGAPGGTLALGSHTLTTGGNDGSTMFAGTISGTGGLVKTGSGTLTLSGVNTSTGAIEVQAGSLTLVGGAAVDDTAGVTVLSGAALGLSASEAIGSLAGAGTVALGSSTLTVGGDNTSTQFSGSITGSGGLFKVGSGTLALSGTNTYDSQTTVAEGTLQALGSLSTNTGVSVASGATLAAGVDGIDAGVAALSTGSLLLQSGSVLAADINGTTAGTGYDQVRVHGTVNLAGATLSGSLGYTPAHRDTYTLIDNDGTDAITGTFNGLAEGGTITLGGVLMVASYQGGDGNDFTLTALTNHAPTVASAIADRTATAGAAFSFAFAADTFADADAGDTLAYTTSALPGWLHFDPATRTFSGTPAAPGTVSIDVTADDGNGGTVTDSFDIVVGAAPVIPPDPEPPVVPPPVTPSVPDNDGIPSAVEDQAPGIPGPDGTVVPGDGNGDGIKDSEQPGVGSIGFLWSPTAESNPGSAPPTFTTLVASSQDGKVSSATDNSRITSLKQLDAPQHTPEGMQTPIGLVSFTIALGAGKTGENFSLYLDPALGVNGYWKQDAQGQWVNLASEPYGGKMVTEGGRTRLDFHIEDGGQFDADGKADGIITDPGAPAYLPLSLTGQAPDLPHGFWF